MEKTYLITADTFFPDENSAALQLRDLADALSRKGFNVVVLCPNRKELINDYQIHERVKIVRSPGKSPKETKTYIERLFLEVILPFKFFLECKRKKIHAENVTFIAYSPSIFLFILRILLNIPKHKSILILRDLFPFWAKDLGIIKSKFVFFCFKLVAVIQYRSFGKIYCQSSYDTQFISKYNLKTETLNNWLRNPSTDLVDILPAEINKFMSSNKKTIVYAGNVGVAQNVDRLLVLANQCKNLSIQFLIVGSGEKFLELVMQANAMQLENILIHGSVSQKCLSQIFYKADVGFVSLSADFRTENVPGKFVNYLAHGLSVCCDCANNKTLAWYFDKYEIGIIKDFSDLKSAHFALLELVDKKENQSLACFEENFSVESTVSKIMVFDE